MKQKISFVYFDVGGVALLDFSGNSKWKELLADIGITETNKTKFDALWEKYQDRICLDYDVDQIRDEVNQVCGLKLKPDFSFLNEFVKRFAPNPSIWPVIEAAHKSYRIGLLTGMYPRMLAEIYKRGDLLPLFPWDVVLDSSVIKLQKPYAAVYELAEKLAGVKDSSELLFIDNVEKNLQVPKARGWQTFLYDPKEPEKSSRKLLRLIN
jgi:FMN phosphatase YigB (HAD superfamily)